MILACAVACGPQHPQFVPPSNPAPLQLGINLGPERMTPRYLDRLAASGKPLVLRVPVRSQGQARDVLRSVVAYPSLSVLLLVEQPDLDLVAALAPLDREAWPGRLAGIELTNEADLQGLPPAQFAAFTVAALARLRDWRSNIVSGAIYTVDEDSLAYAAPMLAVLPCSAIFGVHAYEAFDAGALQQAAGCHRVAITEAGCPSRTAHEDTDCANLAEHQLADARRFGALSWIGYQLVSGPSTSDLDNFGWLRVDDSPKPIWRLLP